MANAARLPWRELTTVFRTDNAPFAYVALRAWTGVFGDSELTLRSLSIVAYAAAVLLTGLAATVRGPLAGLTAAALVASSVRIGITQAATARPYALLAAFSAAATFFTIRFLVTPGSAKWARVAALAVIHLLGLLTHPTYVFVLIACGAGSLTARRDLRAPTLWAAGLALGVYGVAWGRVLMATVGSQATSWMQPPTFADLKTAYLSLWGTGPGFMLAGALLVVSLSNVARTRTVLADGVVRWAAIAVVVGWCAPIAVSFFQPVFLAVRTPVMLLPLSAVFVAFFLVAAASRAAVVTLVAIFSIAAATQVVAAARAGDPTPTHASIQRVVSAASCGDVLVAVGLSHAPVDYYMPRVSPRGCIAVVHFPANMLNWTGRSTDIREMAAVRDEADRLVARLSSDTGAAWMLTAESGMGHEASAVLIEIARGRLRCADAMPLKGAFFDRVTRCVRAPQPGG